MTQGMEAGAPSRGARRRVLSTVLTALLAVYAAAVLAKMAVEPESFQFSFRMYYVAGQAFDQGENPYDRQVLSRLAGRPIYSGYVYPPITLNVVWLLARLDYVTAYRLYLGLKCVALVFLLWLWRTKLVAGQTDAVFWLVCLIGFNYAIYWDLSAGNISLFEQALLWLAFLSFMKGRLGAFGVCVATAAFFKLTLILFLVLLLFSKARTRWVWFFGAGTIFLLIELVSAALYPQFFADYLRSISGVVTQIDTEATVMYKYPATWPLIKSLTAALGQKVGMTIPPALQLLAYGAVVLGVTGMSGCALWFARGKERGDPRLALVVMCCFVYVLTVPRLMNYSYIVLLVPAYLVMRELRYVPAVALLLVLMAVSTTGARPPGFRAAAEMLGEYYPLTCAYILWACYLYLLRRSGGESVLVPRRGEVMGV